MTEKPHLLFICGKNQWRSPTAARIYANDPRIEVRSAGVSPKSVRSVSLKDIEWADLILVMEKKHRARLQELFPEAEFPAIESLDIPDDYPFMDPELIELIKEGVESILQEEDLREHG